jgi:hypothetical protein
MFYSRVFEMRDVETVSKYAYFESVRRSLPDQIVAAYLRRSGVQMSPFPDDGERLVP